MEGRDRASAAVIRLRVSTKRKKGRDLIAVTRRRTGKGVPHKPPAGRASKGTGSTRREKRRKHSFNGGVFFGKKATWEGDKPQRSTKEQEMTLVTKIRPAFARKAKRRSNTTLTLRALTDGKKKPKKRGAAKKEKKQF